MTKEQAYRWLTQAGIQTILATHDRHTKEALDVAIKALIEQKVGKWLIKKSNLGYPECSICGHVFDFGGATDSFMDEAKYCPNCGTKMENNDGAVG